METERLRRFRCNYQVAAACRRQSNPNLTHKLIAAETQFPEKKKKSEPWTAQRRREKKAEKLRLFHNNRARTLAEETSRVKFSPHRLLALRCSGLSLTTLSIRRTNSLAGSSTPMAPLRAPPNLGKSPHQVAGQGGILEGERSKFHGQGAIELDARRNCGGSGMGVGEGIGSDGARGRDWRREREEERERERRKRKCVLVGSCSCFV